MHIIKPNVVGWGVYSSHYHWEGKIIEGLHFVEKTKEECEEYCKEHGMDYDIKENDVIQ